MARVTYIGTVDDTGQIIEQDGFTFTKGEAVDVPDDHPRLGKFKSNPTFAVDGDPVELPDNPDELAAVRAELDKRGVAYTTNAKLPALRKKLQDATDE